MNKQEHIINYFCGKEKKLNLLQNLPKVPDVQMSKVFKQIERMEEDSKYEHEPIESDLYNHKEDE